MSAATLPPRLARDAHKGDAGRLLCLCGSAAYPGAAILVARAAQRAGAGLVTVGCLDAGLSAVIAGAAPEAVNLDLSATVDLVANRLPRELARRHDHARVVGPGLGATQRTRVLVRTLLAEESSRAPMVLDADALNVVAGELELLRGARVPLVLTPHPGEAARLLELDALPRDDEGRAECARELARRTGAVCCLKGHATIVTDGERLVRNTTGNPGMATAGAGDVLAGILGAYLCQVRDAGSYDAFDAAVCAVHVHGRAGDLAAAELGERALVASDLVRFLPAAQRELEQDA